MLGKVNSYCVLSRTFLQVSNHFSSHSCIVKKVRSRSCCRSAFGCTKSEDHGRRDKSTSRVHPLDDQSGHLPVGCLDGDRDPLAAGHLDLAQIWVHVPSALGLDGLLSTNCPEPSAKPCRMPANARFRTTFAVPTCDPRTLGRILASASRARSACRIQRHRLPRLRRHCLCELGRRQCRDVIAAAEHECDEHGHRAVAE